MARVAAQPVPARCSWRGALLLAVIATCAFAFACGPTPSPQVAAISISPSDSLLGTWRATRFKLAEGADTTRAPYGVEPRGYIVYDATRHVFFQALRPSAMDSLKLGWRREAPDSTLLRLVTEGYMAYFGTYEVNTTERTIMHKIEGELRPRGGSYEMATPYRFEGDTLVISGWRFVKLR